MTTKWPVTRPSVAKAIAAFVLDLRKCIMSALKCGSQNATLQTAAKIIILDSTAGNDNLVTKPSNCFRRGFDKRCRDTRPLPENEPIITTMEAAFL